MKDAEFGIKNPIENFSHKPKNINFAEIK